MNVVVIFSRAVFLDRDKYKVLYNRSFDKELAKMCSLLSDTLRNTSDSSIYGY